jgi:hypothetical protein
MNGNCSTKLDVQKQPRLAGNDGGGMQRWHAVREFYEALALEQRCCMQSFYGISEPR